MPNSLSWIEIDGNAVKSNLTKFIQLLPEQTKLLAVVKGNAYGHDMISIAKIAIQAGSDWLGVFHLGEAEELRQASIKSPILVLGYIPKSDLIEAIEIEARITVSSLDYIDHISQAAKKTGKKTFLHLKLETGTNRLGLSPKELELAVNKIKQDQLLVLEGTHTHFANIEDTTEHDYAKGQLQRFEEMLDLIRTKDEPVPLPHTACTAAAILFPNTYFSMVRIGIGMYGLWPSKETYLSALQQGKREPLELEPVMSWKTRVIQVKEVPSGEYIGYGCTYRTTRKTTLAILPIGYANGYDRKLSNRGHVLIGDVRAPIRGRVCMNLTMVDVTDIERVCLEDEVVLLGKQGSEEITAEQMAGWAQTINYEIVTRAEPFGPRHLLEK
jgi:alanine racemase